MEEEKNVEPCISNRKQKLFIAFILAHFERSTIL
jgi:hypothetical protein